MKSQGLPLNFIVLGALALLVLVVAVAFFIAGGATFGSAVSAQAAKTTCDNKCIEISRAEQSSAISSSATGIDAGDEEAKGYCLSKFFIQGQGEKFCDDIATCTVTYADGTNCLMACTDIAVGETGYDADKDTNSGAYTC